mmetsp:Transcript_43490/g.41953  ORF Transcript_43490/g.41953 Transcript_43490/m.41953 type:complete len:157 (+) Transcript_43490:1120-1590(+)
MHNFARPSLFQMVESEIVRMREENRKHVLAANEIVIQETKFYKGENEMKQVGAELRPPQSTSSKGKNHEELMNKIDKIQFTPPHRMWLFATMRAILDSKFAEHKAAMLIEANGLQNISRFPDFVYSWLGKFEYDIKNFRVKSLETFDQEQADSYRV